MTTSSSRQRNYLAAFWPESVTQMKEIHHITENGLKMFEENFGFPSQTFIACNYVMPRELESTIFRAGVDLIQGQRGELLPSADGQTVSIRRSYTGQRNALGQYYSVRNVKFEPFEDRSRDWVASALSEIRQAFFWANRQSSRPIELTTSAAWILIIGIVIFFLNSLLKKILITWPDVEFVSSDELFAMMAH
jgi:hypothetical protein